MKDILRLVFLVCIIIIVFLWMVDRRKWKRRNADQVERDRVCLRQEEKTENDIKELERELAQIQEENREIKAQIRVQKEQRRELERRRLAVKEQTRKTLMKVHLYVQLLKEQCGTAGAQKQCDKILLDCKDLMEDLEEKDS